MKKDKGQLALKTATVRVCVMLLVITVDGTATVFKQTLPVLEWGLTCKTAVCNMQNYDLSCLQQYGHGDMDC